MIKIMLIILIFYVLGCDNKDSPVDPSLLPFEKDPQTITYQESDEDFANPERVFMRLR